ncbi:MAG TPA: hypothetical protein VIA11_14740 [Acidimicrobiia bacterium]|jgi:hypothetical protein|nr:hypothetical protein [Acidimicrobiia bacterium]
MEPNAAFLDLLAQLSDGARWKVLSGHGRREFAERVTQEIVELEPRRRQAIVMCLFALLAMDMQPEDLAGFVAGRDMSDDAEVEALIAWLRENYEPDG